VSIKIHRVIFSFVKIGEVTAVLFRDINDFIPVRSLLIFQFVGYSVLAIYLYYC